MIAALLLYQLQSAKYDSEDAQIALCGAVTGHAEAKSALELAEAHKFFKGLVGKNEKERAAKRRLELSAEYTALAEVEEALTRHGVVLRLLGLSGTRYSCSCAI